MKTSIACAGLAASGSLAFGKSKQEVPSYLKGYEELYAKDPRKSAIEWFRDAGFGLFIHYGPNALISTIDGRVAKNDWLQLREKLSVKKYEKIARQFRAEKFDADFITDMVLDAEMKYVTLTTRHHDSFCLFDSKYTNFNSTNTPAKRDLVGEMAEQCQKKGLGFCLYYSHGRDWRHPHAANNDGWGGSARPAAKDPYYKYGEEHDLQRYLDFMKNQITELLTNYGPIASIWLDGISTPLKPKGNNNKDMFKCQELYDYIHSLQPQVLVSYKQGLTGTEDYLAPERKWNRNITKPLEICDTLQSKQWFYNKALDGKHKSPDQVMAMLTKAQKMGANLLLNTGPLPDGSIHPDDISTLKEVGRRLRNQ
jgi:alpha-L-fucosidase